MKLAPLNVEDDQGWRAEKAACTAPIAGTHDDDEVLDRAVERVRRDEIIPRSSSDGIVALTDGGYTV